MKRRPLTALALVAISLGACLTQASPAAAWYNYCPSTTNPVFCTIAYETYPGGTTGLRSSGEGTFTGSMLGSTDKVSGQVHVRDISEDGYRARVWVYLYGCWCTDPSEQLLYRELDSHTPTGNWWPFEWSHWNGYEWDLFTLRVIVGRYQGSTGRYNQREPQDIRFSLGAN